MSSPFNNNLYQSIAIVLLAVLAANLIVGNVLEQPKIGQAFFADIAHFLLRGLVFIWEIGKDVAAAAFRQMAQKELNWENAKQWAWEKTKSAAAKALKTAQKHIMDQMVDRLTDYIEGRETPSGKSQYVKDWKGVFLDALAMGAYEFSQELAGIDLCSPLGFETKAEAKALLEIPIPKFSQEMVCSREQIVQNVTGFYTNFEGGWDAWLKITHPNQNFYGSYLMALDAKVDAMARAQQAETLKIEAGSGWRGLEECVKWFYPKLKATFEKDYSGDIREIKTKTSALQYLVANEFQIDVGAFPVPNPDKEKFPELYRLIECNTTGRDGQDDIDIELKAQECIWACLMGKEINLATDTEGASVKDLDCINSPNCQGISQACLIETSGGQCTAQQTKTPGDLVGRGVAQALGYESEWFLDSEDFGQYSAAIVNSGIARVARFGLDKFNKVTSWASSLFGGDKEAEAAARVDASAFCQDEPDIISRRACQMCPGLTKGSKAYKACMDYSKARVAEELLVSGAFGQNMDWANLQGLALLEQAIETKEAVSRALQRMGGAAYYSNTRDPIKNLKYLIKCRWQNCASHEIRRFLIQYCGLYPVNDYNALAVREEDGVLNFNAAPDDDSIPSDFRGNKGGALKNCDVDDSARCKTLLVQKYAGKYDVRREYYCRRACAAVSTANDECMDACLQNPHDGNFGRKEFRFPACLELSILEALGPYGADTIGNYYLLGSSQIQDKDNIYYPYITTENFTDPKWQNACLSPTITCPGSASGWTKPIACFEDMTWRQANFEHSQFYQKSARFSGNNLISGWWDYESKITINNKIKDLEKEIGQDSGYPQLYSPALQDLGVIDMTYEYYEICENKCQTSLQPDQCMYDCTHIDVFSELTVEDIDAMLKPFGVEQAKKECTNKTGENFDACVKDEMVSQCTNHCNSICNNAACKTECEDACKNQKSLGINCNYNNLFCSKQERQDKIGSLRILQWDILAYNRSIEAGKEIKEFTETVLNQCPTPLKDYADKALELQKQKAEAERDTLSFQAKQYALELYYRETGQREPPVLWGISAPMFYLWMNWDLSDRKTPPQPRFSSCDHYTDEDNNGIADDKDLIQACATGCKRRNNTFAEWIENWIQTEEKKLETKTNQIPSQTELQNLQSELESINDLMDPETIKNKNREIIQKLDDEHCKDRLGRSGMDWPGQDQP